MATAAPPLGPQLGQRGLNVANFCKEFNKETGHIKPGCSQFFRLELCALEYLFSLFSLTICIVPLKLLIFIASFKL